MIQMAAPRLKTEVDDHYSATVSNLSDKNVLKEIRSRLTADQLALLKETCFGPLLDVSLKFQGALFHCLLLRELVVADVNPLEMWFEIAGHHVRFSAHEFGLVSGLRLGNLPAESSFQLPTVHRLRDLYFLGSQKIRLKDYREKFTSTNFYTVPDQDAVKLALILILELYLHGRDKRRFVNPFHMQLVDDLDRFNAYPWGTFTWCVTYRYFQEALSGRVARYSDRIHSKTARHQEKYSIGGCPLVFQVCS